MSDDKNGVVMLEPQRQLKRASTSPLESRLAGGASEELRSGTTAVIMPFPEMTAGGWGQELRRGWQSDSGQSSGGRGAAIDDGCRWNERGSTGVGAVLLAVEVCDFPSLKLSFGERVVAGAVDLFELRLRDIFRDGDAVVRTSSNGFHVMLESSSDGRVAAEAAQRILNQCTGLYSLNGVSIRLSSNIGIALQPDGRIGTEQLMQGTRVALRESEAEGHNTYRFYTKEIGERLRRQAHIGSELRGALEEGRLVLHYQPQYEMEQGRLIGFEALLRLRTRSGELWGADRFIADAEQKGSTIPIGRWVLEEACRQLKISQAKGQPGLIMAVNVSPRQLADELFVDTVEHVLAASGLGPRDIELEVAERQVLGADPAVQNTISRLNERNFQLALEDFGTSYSSFAYLTSLPVSTVKLARGFVADLPGDVRARQFVRGLVKLLRELGLRFLADGVETDEQERFLIEIGCPYGQGFGLGVPLSAEDSASLFSAD